MTSEYFNIVSVENGTELSKVIRSTYGSLRYLLEPVTLDRDIQEILALRVTNLLVIDNDAAGYSAEQVRLFHQTNAHLFIILVTEDKAIVRALAECNLIRTISANEITMKLSPILSEAYSDFTENIYNGSAYANLLKSSFNNLSGMVIIANQQGDMVFLNLAAEQILGIDENMHHEENIVSALVEGPKIWKYIRESCCKTESDEQTFLLQFFNKRQDILTRRIHIRPIEVDQQYFLLQEQLVADENSSLIREMESNILETFSESVANELLNPVNVLSGRLQLLQGEITDKNPLLKHLDSISMQIKRIDEIIAKLLTFARIKKDIVPQKIDLNEILKGVQLDPSISRLVQLTGIEINLISNQDIPILFGQVAQFDLLFKMVLEICFSSLGTSGTLKLNTQSENDNIHVHFSLTYASDLYEDEISLLAYLGTEQESDKQKSIETKIIQQILQQYNAKYTIIRPERNTEKLTLSFPISQSFN